MHPAEPKFSNETIVKFGVLRLSKNLKMLDLVALLLYLCIWTSPLRGKYRRRFLCETRDGKHDQILLQYVTHVI